MAPALILAGNLLLTDMGLSVPESLPPPFPFSLSISTANAQTAETDNTVDNKIDQNKPNLQSAGNSGRPINPKLWSKLAAQPYPGTYQFDFVNGVVRVTAVALPNQLSPTALVIEDDMETQAINLAFQAASAAVTSTPFDSFVRLGDFDNQSAILKSTANTHTTIGSSEGNQRATQGTNGDPRTAMNSHVAASERAMLLREVAAQMADSLTITEVLFLSEGGVAVRGEASMKPALDAAANLLNRHLPSPKDVTKTPSGESLLPLALASARCGTDREENATVIATAATTTAQGEAVPVGLDGEDKKNGEGAEESKKSQEAKQGQNKERAEHKGQKVKGGKQAPCGSLLVVDASRIKNYEPCIYPAILDGDAKPVFPKGSHVTWFKESRTAQTYASANDLEIQKIKPVRVGDQGPIACDLVLTGRDATQLRKAVEERWQKDGVDIWIQVSE